MTPPTTTAANSAEGLLDRIALKSLEALDPCLTRESVVRIVKDIYRLAAPPLNDDGQEQDGESNSV
jgi:hypothetical protein